MTIGQRIALKRKEQKLSQESLGEVLGVSRQSVYKWESDAALPEIDKLVAMSRLFNVTVGWLLGVESAGDECGNDTGGGPGTAAGSEGEEPLRQENGEELNEEQIKMVREIVDRYIAAQPKKRRWPWVVCAALLLAALFNLHRQMDTLNDRYNNLQSSVSSINHSVSSQINGITGRVEEILESQNSLLAGSGVELLGMDIPQNTISIYAEATPKTYVEGMSAVFSVDTGEETREYPAELGAGNRFFAEIVCPLTDTTLVSVVFITGEKRETQLLKDYMGLYNASFPTVSVDSHFLLLWKELDGEGNLVFDERNGDNYAWRQKMISTPYENGIEPAALREVKVGLFKNQELVAWMEPCEQPSHYQGDWDAEQFYRMPDMTIRPEREDVFTIGTLIIDEYGRERLEIESPYSVDEKGEELTHSENFVKADWFDTSSGWKY